ncbi:response regulator [Planctobacterium marinum]|uniref:response regulator n=1 Tax=Planctobacterium marinum TaxID=1631968 RepID=UPI001E585383|nr:response regulator [Planctobacterium marinum]MCC2606463.1 response regulator [Planctobacterium marinum]
MSITEPLERPRILIIDDEKSNLKILSDLLSSEAEVAVAKSGTQGLWKASKLKPDLILLDIVMPEMDGFETLKQLKQDEQLKDTSVIFITGLDTVDNEKYGLDLGALDYIRKPFNGAVVKTRIATHLKLIRQTKELRALSVKLREADQAKSRFLANMSHEIRTPLTAIIGYTELLQNDELSGMDNDQAIDIISNSGKHLLNLINDILDLSKIEAKKLQVECVEFCLPLLLEELISLIKPKIEQHNLAFELGLQFPLPSHIVSDPTRLKQVLLNLLNNAVKFTEEGVIRLLVAESDGALKFNVIDTGVGISKEQQTRIFSAFEQADVSVTRRFGGTGLGLNISKYLAQKLGGDLVVSSVSGIGSDFCASIALRTGENAEPVSDELCYANVIHCQKAQKPVQPVLTGKVLLAEDQKELRLLITMMLHKLGLEVVAVENGLQLLDEATANSFDLILTDIHMPEMGGEEAVTRLQEAHIDIPTIALTANAMKHEVEQYISKGFTDHLSKPIQREEFSRKLAMYLPELTPPSAGRSSHQSEKARFIEQFKRDLPERLEVMENAFFSQDWRHVALLAHSLSSTARSFQLDAITRVTAEIERLAMDTIADSEHANELAAVILSLKAQLEAD